MNEQTEFVIKCVKGLVTLFDVYDIKLKLAKILRLDPVALQLFSIKKGCVELHFLISVAVADHLFPVSPSQHSALEEIGIRILSHNQKNGTFSSGQSDEGQLIVTPDKKPKRKDINRHIKPLAAHKWHSVGVELEVGDEDGLALDEIRLNTSDSDDCFDQMIGLWLKDTDPSRLTWRVLLDSLERLKIDVDIDAIIQETLSASGLNATNEPGGNDETVKSKTEAPHNLPPSIDGPPLPTPISEEPDISYKLSFPKGIKIRNYQEELAQPGIEGKNYIVVAPTGSGKTLVAARVISDHLQKGKELDEDRRVIFIVDKRPLAQQQTEQLKMLIPSAKIVPCTGDGAADNTVRNAFKTSGAHVVVCTAGKLLVDLKNGLSLSEFSLMIFDECHHTRKRSPYAEIMIQNIQDKREGSKLPQVMGLTASPGAGDNPRQEKTVTIDHLVKLCALMDATHGIKVVRENKAELDEHTNKPDQNIQKHEGRDEGELFIIKIIQLMSELEKEVKFSCPFEPWSQRYETQVQQHKKDYEASLNPAFRNDVSILGLLCCLNRALDTYMDLQYEDAMDVLEKHDLPSHENANSCEKDLHKRLKFLIFELKCLPRVCNILFDEMKRILAKHFPSEKAKAMIIVRTKKHASSIHCWAENDLPKALGINPCMAVGQTESATGDGMTQSEQQNSFKHFKKGPKNLLITTSIREEGIDVAACNLVIRYQHVSDEIAKAQTTGRARASGECEVYTILSSFKKHEQELKNAELLELVHDVLEKSHFPSGEILTRKIEKEQEIILKKGGEKPDKPYRAEDVQLLCKHCKEPACSAADVYVIKTTSHVVPCDKFQSKIEKKQHPDPVKNATIEIAHKIHCKECGKPWGNVCKWPSSAGRDFPVLKCSSFIFKHNDSSFSLKQWSKAPFELKEYKL